MAFNNIYNNLINKTGDPYCYYDYNKHRPNFNCI